MGPFHVLNSQVHFNDLVTGSCICVKLITLKTVHNINSFNSPGYICIIITSSFPFNRVGKHNLAIKESVYLYVTFVIFFLINWFQN